MTLVAWDRNPMSCLCFLGRLLRTVTDTRLVHSSFLFHSSFCFICLSLCLVDLFHYPLSCLSSCFFGNDPLSCQGTICCLFYSSFFFIHLSLSLFDLFHSSSSGSDTRLVSFVLRFVSPPRNGKIALQTPRTDLLPCSLKSRS